VLTDEPMLSMFETGDEDAAQSVWPARA
jgi:hypothetical protein